MTVCFNDLPRLCLHLVGQSTGHYCTRYIDYFVQILVGVLGENGCDEGTGLFGGVLLRTPNKSTRLKVCPLIPGTHRVQEIRNRGLDYTKSRLHVFFTVNKKNVSLYIGVINGVDGFPVSYFQRFHNWKPALGKIT